MNRPRVMLAEGHRLVLEALRNLLESCYDVVGTCCNGRALLESAPSLRPDVVIVGITMPHLNGLEASRLLKQKMPRIKVIFLTMHHDPRLAFEAMRAGAFGYVLKDCGSSELFRAIEEVLKGRSYVTPRIASGMLDVLSSNRERRERHKALTPRQLEVIRLLAEGKTMMEASDVLNVKRRTIAFHKYSIMRQLGLKTTGELFQFAVKNRLIEEERLPRGRSETAPNWAIGLPDGCLKTADAAAMVHIAKSTLLNWMHKGKFRAPDLQLRNGHAVRLWQAADIERLRALKAEIYREKSSGGRNSLEVKRSRQVAPAGDLTWR